MANLDIDLNDDLVEWIQCLAKRHYGDSGNVCVARVVESALEMRLVATKLAEGGANETEEAMVDWEFAERQPAKQLPVEIRDLLFKGR